MKLIKIEPTHERSGKSILCSSESEWKKGGQRRKRKKENEALIKNSTHKSQGSAKLNYGVRFLWPWLIIGSWTCYSKLYQIHFRKSRKQILRGSLFEERVCQATLPRGESVIVALISCQSCREHRWSYNSRQLLSSRRQRDPQLLITARLSSLWAVNLI